MEKSNSCEFLIKQDKMEFHANGTNESPTKYQTVYTYVHVEHGLVLCVCAIILYRISEQNDRIFV